jgi:hypothetical protein
VELDGRALLYAAERSEVVVLNQTASDVWWLLDGEQNLSELLEVLARAYSTTPETIEADVRDVLLTFEESRLITLFDRS